MAKQPDPKEAVSSKGEPISKLYP